MTQWLPRKPTNRDKGRLVMRKFFGCFVVTHRLRIKPLLSSLLSQDFTLSQIGQSDASRIIERKD